MVTSKNINEPFCKEQERVTSEENLRRFVESSKACDEKLLRKIFLLDVNKKTDCKTFMTVYNNRKIVSCEKEFNPDSIYVVCKTKKKNNINPYIITAVVVSIAIVLVILLIVLIKTIKQHRSNYFRFETADVDKERGLNETIGSNETLQDKLNLAEVDETIPKVLEVPQADLTAIFEQNLESMIVKNTESDSDENKVNMKIEGTESNSDENKVNRVIKTIETNIDVSQEPSNDVNLLQTEAGLTAIFEKNLESKEVKTTESNSNQNIGNRVIQNIESKPNENKLSMATKTTESNSDENQEPSTDVNLLQTEAKINEELKVASTSRFLDDFKIFELLGQVS